MVSKAILKGYDFQIIEDYFQYIIDSRVNGQPKQAKELFAKLSKSQEVDFYQWFEVAYYYECLDSECYAEFEIVELMKFFNK